MYYYGAEVSEETGIVDWAKLKTGQDHKYKFACIRLGKGMKPDARAVENVRGAYEAGLAIGGYWKGEAVTQEEAQQEAEACLNVLWDICPDGLVPFDLAVYYHWEEADRQRAIAAGHDYPRAGIQRLCLGFSEHIRRGGYRTGFGFDRALFDLYRRGETFTGRGLQPFVNQQQWCTERGDRPSSAINFGLWSHTDMADIPGIDGWGHEMVLWSVHLIGRVLFPIETSEPPSTFHKHITTPEADCPLYWSPDFDRPIMEGEIDSIVRRGCLVDDEGHLLLKRGWSYPAMESVQDEHGLWVRFPWGGWILAWDRKTGLRNAV